MIDRDSACANSGLVRGELVELGTLYVVGDKWGEIKFL